MYSYRNSIKSDKSDELINTYVLRPIAGILVWVLYRTPITPNQVTMASIVSGLVAALFYLKGTASAFAVAGLLVTLKDILDSADGQLARAKHQQSRAGRFLDSIGDFLVDAAVFGSIGWTLYQMNHDWMMLFASFLGFIGISLRVSYHVFYQVHFLHLRNQYEKNRITEEITEDDLNNSRQELILQQLFQIIYGWQDRLMVRIDEWSAARTFRKSLPTDQWYSDTLALRLSGLLGFGTELFLLMGCSVINKLKLYLFLNVFLMNGILIICILYRRFGLSIKCFNGNHS